MTPLPPLTPAEITDISKHLMAAATPNSPDRVLKAWRVLRPGAIWLLITLDDEEVELYRHEIVEYVSMLKAAGIVPAPAKRIHWPGDNA